MRDLTPGELDGQATELLPTRETLTFDLSFANVYATNASLALNAVTYDSAAYSAAVQTIVQS
ncbi:hypothetical protein [Georgenia sp. SYP-B2076]|uniref:hypothetical protein n=1 Tax=Georgenia sp. SYP-B2076 TaxID=2495881 RepID=UPI000F8D72A4|nr:hypothetical protein [Georgenia sp. SYP-B2076]